MTIGPPHLSVPVSDGALPVWQFGAGPAVVLVHGWALDARIWMPQISDLSRQFRIVLYDRRGCGKASAPPDPAQEVDDLAAVLSACAIGDHSIVSMSQGVRIALHHAVRGQGPVKRIVLQGPPPLPCLDIADAENLPLNAICGLAESERFGELALLLNSLALLSATTPPARELIAEILCDYRARDLIGGSRPLDVSLAMLSRIGIPALLMTGEYETAPRKEAAVRIAKAIGEAQAVEVRGGSHLCNVDATNEFNRLLCAFLQA